MPDDRFEQALINLNIDKDGVVNDSVATADVSGIIELNVFSKYISDLTGIESFTSLKILNCGGNTLTSLDVSQNIALLELICNQNQLTSLDVSMNTVLSELRCEVNRLTNLDVNSNINLTELICGVNRLTNLDVAIQT